MNEKEKYQMVTTQRFVNSPPVTVQYPGAPPYSENSMNQMYISPQSYSDGGYATPNQYQTGPIPITDYSTTSRTGNPTIFQEPQNVYNIYTLEKYSANVHCSYCSNNIFTRVERKISSNGMAWAILCFFCGSWCLCLLVFCVDRFREFIHYCSVCNSLLGTYKPKFSGGYVCLLIFLSFIIIG